MNVSAAIEKAKKGVVLPVYLVGGEELLLVSRLCEAVREATVGRGPRGLAEDLFDGRGTTAGTVLTACRTLPMMAKRRLVTVRGVDQMSAVDQEALVPYFANPEPTTVLLLVALTLDKRRKLLLEAKKANVLFEAEHPRDDEAARWIAREASARGITMEPGAVESLGLSIGTDLAQLADAIERLALYTNNGSVTAQTVDTVVTPVREIPAFDLSTAVAERKRARALAVVVRLLHQGQDPLPIMGLLAWQIGQLARAKEYAIRPDPERTLAQVLKTHPGRVQEAVTLAAQWTVPQLQRAFRILAATDIALKGGRKTVDKARGLIAIEAVLALCGAAGMGEISA